MPGPSSPTFDPSAASISGAPDSDLGLPASERQAVSVKAQSLADRMAKATERRETASHNDAALDATAEARLHRWIERASGGDARLFDKRLQWDNWTRADAHMAVQSSPEHTQTASPAPWTVTLSDGLKQTEYECPTVHRAQDEQDPLPFEHAFLGFVDVASMRLEEQTAFTDFSPNAAIASSAVRDLERNLLRRLSRTCSKALYAEFSIHASLSAPLLSGAGPESGPGSQAASSSDASYRSFIDHLQTGGLRAFFAEYSVLARLVAVIVEQWVANAGRLLERVEADRNALRTVLGKAPGQLQAISPERSDPHGGGATVHILTFDRGNKVVYKPKPVDLCAAFQNLLRWCNREGAPVMPELKPMCVVPKDGYGWVEFVNHEPCDTAEEVATFFRRAGALMALAYALNGEDLHHGNIIAAGAHPVLIDTEVLLCPSIDTDFSPGSGMDARSALTVMQTGMLPTWSTGNEDNANAMSNLGGLFGYGERRVTSRCWTNVNTDDMTWGTAEKTRPASINLPIFKGSRQTAREHLDAIVDGFSSAYDLLQTQRDNLLASDGPLSEFADTPSRFVFRGTDVYGKTLRRLQHPQFLREGIDRDIELDFLGRGFIRLAERPAYWSVVRVERDELNQGNIPLFRVRTGGRRLYTETGEDLGECFLSSGMEVARAKIRTLDEQDRGLQCSLIRAAFYSIAVPGAHDAPSPTLATRETTKNETAALTPRAARTEAIRIADQLIASRVQGADGHQTWLALVRNAPSGRLRVTHTGRNLHDGRTGIALFFASLSAVLSAHGREDKASVYASHARETMMPVVEELDENPAVLFMNLNRCIGATLGAGSVVYGLTRIGRLLDDSSLMASAGRAADMLTADVIRADTDFDLVSGAAGAILGLVALYDETGDSDVLRRADIAGRHLLDQRVMDDASGCRAWRTSGKQLRTGFSHGASGIAHALFVLGRATGTEAFTDAAREAMAFEDSLFRERAGNWLSHPPNAEMPADEALWATWCHGAPGILIARLAHMKKLRPGAAALLPAARRTTSSAIEARIDHLCCGDAGRILALHDDGRGRDEVETRTAARRGAARLIQRAHDRGHYRLTADPHPLPRPGFLQGLAGIGYMLLAITHADVVPPLHLIR